jgi:hypothetical protein
MNSPDKIRYMFQHIEKHSVITIMRGEWEKLVRDDGEPTHLEALPVKLSAVAKQAEVVAIAASGMSNQLSGIDVVRKDIADAPYIYNTDHYTVIEHLPAHSLYPNLLRKVGITDSVDLRSTLESWVWLIGPERIDGVHWATEIPAHVKNAKKKPNEALHPRRLLVTVRAISSLREGTFRANQPAR